ncbi:MAG: c-type cytochrome domain-containing protein [Balneolaceae bacterium]|nr:c-type cytochrome domain-containing protein [Balneolaceae bacterium]
MGTCTLFLASCGGSSTGSNGGGGNGGGGNGGGGGSDRNVSFSEDIEPIFNGNCAVSGCHNATTQESGVNLSSHDAALSSVGDQYGIEVIQPGEPNAYNPQTGEGSPIVDKIENDNPTFGERMPLNSGALDQAEIDSIKAWIDDGAPNN